VAGLLHSVLRGVVESTQGVGGKKEKKKKKKVKWKIKI
jgi:hypothetical protein